MSRFEKDIRPVIRDEAALLSGTLYDGMASSLAKARTDTKSYPYEDFPHLLPMTLRCALRLDLIQRDLPRDWCVSGDPRKMGQLMLSNDRLGVDLRFLKERRRTYPGGVPAAGSNRSRRLAWSSKDAPIDDLELEIPDVEQRVTILWVWDFDGPASRPETGFTLRLVHTTAPGVYGRAVPCNLSLDILPGGEIFDRLKFAGDDEATDFFQDELPETAEDED